MQAGREPVRSRGLISGSRAYPGREPGNACEPGNVRTGKCLTVLDPGPYGAAGVLVQGRREGVIVDGGRGGGQEQGRRGEGLKMKRLRLVDGKI